VAYIGGLVVAALFFLVLHYFTTLDKRQKIITAGVAFGIIMAAVAYNAYSNRAREQMLQAVLEYNRGETIICDSKEINATNYSLSIGTYTFIGKRETPYYGAMVSASRCK